MHFDNEIQNRLEMINMLEWLGIIGLAGLITWWCFKGKKTGQCCAGCETCPLACDRKNIKNQSKEER
ncbi:MAG TPA: hypothetical protein VHY08_29630 [Bacillota bacterium]|nr:hypothetical protein [Bacillota bacterium]